MSSFEPTERNPSTSRMDDFSAAFPSRTRSVTMTERNSLATSASGFTPSNSLFDTDMTFADLFEAESAEDEDGGVDRIMKEMQMRSQLVDRHDDSDDPDDDISMGLDDTELRSSIGSEITEKRNVIFELENQRQGIAERLHRMTEEMPSVDVSFPAAVSEGSGTVGSDVVSAAARQLSQLTGINGRMPTPPAMATAAAAAMPSPTRTNVSLSRSNSSNTNESEDQEVLRVRMAKLAATIQRTTESRYGLLMHQKEVQEKTAEREDEAEESQQQSAKRRPSRHKASERRKSTQQTPSASFSSACSLSTIHSTLMDEMQQHKQSPAPSLSQSMSVKRYCSPDLDDSSRKLSMGTLSSPSSYAHLPTAAECPRRMSTSSANVHPYQSSTPPKTHESSATTPPPTSNTVAPRRAPHTSTMVNHVDFMNGRRKTVTDDLEASRQKLVEFSNNTGVTLMTPKTMARWGATSTTTTHDHAATAMMREPPQQHPSPQMMPRMA